jgi:hypothetical protein
MELKLNNLLNDDPWLTGFNWDEVMPLDETL